MRKLCGLIGKLEMSHPMTDVPNYEEFTDFPWYTML